MRQRSCDNWSMYRIQEAPVRIEKNWMRVSDASGWKLLVREAVLLSKRDGTGQALPE